MVDLTTDTTNTETILKFKLSTVTTPTTPYLDQNPGTSGLRKKVKHFQQQNYLNNFVQSIFLAHTKEEYTNKTLVLGGDGRYWNKEAIDFITSIALANGITQILIGENGLLSTPAVSMLIRATQNCFGGIILSASHNPGGIENDFGIKFNSSNGAPANEAITNRIFEHTKSITSILQALQAGDYIRVLNKNLDVEISGDSGSSLNKSNKASIRSVSTTGLYTKTMQELFDFDLIKRLFGLPKFYFVFDAMHGVSGPYATSIFGDIFGCSKDNLLKCDVLEDFGGLHPDPNLVYAKQLVEAMGLSKNTKNTDSDSIFSFGAACDGDADRNMVLGKKFFVSPSDSLAVVTANHKYIKAFEKTGPIRLC